jgi:hypothetical protein
MADVAVSPDGRSVYVTDAVGNAVAHFRRELETPEPSPATPEVDRIAPTIANLRVSRRRSRTTFRYSLSEPAQ